MPPVLLDCLSGPVGEHRIAGRGQHLECRGAQRAVDGQGRVSWALLGLSRRRLESMGFAKAFDYAGGKTDWMAA